MSPKPKSSPMILRSEKARHFWQIAPGIDYLEALKQKGLTFKPLNAPDRLVKTNGQ